MKARNITTILLGLIVLSIYLSSCGVDRWKAYSEQTATNEWIEDTMRVYYYWEDELPVSNKLNYFEEPFSFFKKLLNKDDKYSSIDSLKSYTTRAIPRTEYSYGFQFVAYKVQGNDNSLLIHVLYVADNSPASEIGLKRGDWILQMNGADITEANYLQLLGAGTMSVTLGYYDAERNAVVTAGEVKQLPAARAINDDPVYYSNIYEMGDKRIGYLVYNHFSAGRNASPTEYNDHLIETFLQFAQADVNEFILDLRYNNGGLVTCATLLCDLLAPNTIFGTQLGYLEYNSNFNPQTYSFTFGNSLRNKNANINLNRLYVLTSRYTASASEMVINCLKPHMDVVLIGSTTEGKNVGSTTFTNQERLITMSPIICKIYNAEGKSNYSNGFNADINIEEAEDLAGFLPFGDTNESMLSTALNCIMNGKYTSKESSTRSTNAHYPIYSSIKQDADNGVIIP